HRAFGGHLEEGCRVLSLAEIALMRVDGIKLARLIDPTTGQKLLQAVPSYAGRNGVSPVSPDQEGSLHMVQKRMARRSGPTSCCVAASCLAGRAWSTSRSPTAASRSS